jgi:hypothetical protein
VPYISSVYLVKGDVLRSGIPDYDLFSSDTQDADMAFCTSVRSKVGQQSFPSSGGFT